MSQLDENKRKVFSKKLKTIMKNWEESNGTKLTQETLARALFVQRETVSRWIRGISCPREDDPVWGKLCDFLKVPYDYFTKYYYNDGWTYIDKDTHNNLNDACEEVSKKIGLSESFVSFLKSRAELADMIIQLSTVDGILQSDSPDVPKLPDHIYQFVSSSGVKIYPSKDVLYMLCVIQRETEDYLQFLISKYSKVYENHREKVHEINSKAKNKVAEEIERRGSFIWINQKTQEDYPKSPIYVFSDILRGRENLSIDENRILDLYRSINEEGKDAVYSTLMRERKKHPTKRTKEIKDAARKSIKTKNPMPPISEINQEDTENDK